MKANKLNSTQFEVGDLSSRQVLLGLWQLEVRQDSFRCCLAKRRLLRSAASCGRTCPAWEALARRASGFSSTHSICHNMHSICRLVKQRAYNLKEML